MGPQISTSKVHNQNNEKDVIHKSKLQYQVQVTYKNAFKARSYNKIH